MIKWYKAMSLSDKHALLSVMVVAILTIALKSVGSTTKTIHYRTGPFVTFQECADMLNQQKLKQET